jgi:hypothetical protein
MKRAEKARDGNNPKKESKIEAHESLYTPTIDIAFTTFFFTSCAQSHQYKYSVCEPCISSNLIKYKAAPNLIIF